MAQLHTQVISKDNYLIQINTIIFRYVEKSCKAEKLLMKGNKEAYFRFGKKERRK